MTEDKRIAEESGKYKIKCKSFQEVIDIDLITRVRIENAELRTGHVLILWFEQKSGIDGPVEYYEEDFESPTWLAMTHFFLEEFPGI